jgi:hypothetical protein
MSSLFLLITVYQFGDGSSTSDGSSNTTIDLARIRKVGWVVKYFHISFRAMLLIYQATGQGRHLVPVTSRLIRLHFLRVHRHNPLTRYGVRKCTLKNAAHGSTSNFDKAVVIII